MIEPQEMHLTMAYCVEHKLSPVLLSGDGKFIVDLDPQMPQEAVDRAWSYHRTQPRIGIDLQRSNCVAITSRLDSGDAAVAALELNLGQIASTNEQSRFKQDGRTATGRHVRSVRVARWPHADSRPKRDIRDGELSVTVTGYALFTMSVAIEPLGEEWTAYIAGIRAAQAIRAQAEREADFAWRNGTHPAQKPNLNSKRLLEAFKIQHGGALLDLAEGAVIDDPRLLGSLEDAGALIGSLDEMPRARNLKPGEARFRSSFRAAMGVGGWRSYREGYILTGVSMSDVNELRHAGAVLDFGGDVIAANSEFFSNPTPPRGARKTA